MAVQDFFGSQKIYQFAAVTNLQVKSAGITQPTRTFIDDLTITAKTSHRGGLKSVDWANYLLVITYTIVPYGHYKWPRVILLYYLSALWAVWHCKKLWVILLTLYFVNALWAISSVLGQLLNMNTTVLLLLKDLPFIIHVQGLVSYYRTWPTWSPWRMSPMALPAIPMTQPAAWPEAQPAAWLQWPITRFAVWPAAQPVACLAAWVLMLRLACLVKYRACVRHVSCLEYMYTLLSV